MAKQKKQVAAAVDAVPTLQYINVEDIFPSPLNPRKEFNEADLAELVESIQKVGVIQPITVRKVSSRETSPGVIQVKESFELVCGERRYRSVIVAGINTIPCSVRELTDAEAMELMVTENLQRKDVSPLEEADAFQYMINFMGYELANIAARIGKNESFVTRRLQLLKLIPELKESFIKDLITIGHAELLCRISGEDQKYWLENMLNGYNGAGTIKSLRDFLTSRFDKKLSKAKFDKTIPFAGAVACDLCPANSAYNNSLFPDKADEAICHNSTCFQRKEEAAFVLELESALNDPFILLVQEYSNTTPEIVIKLRKDGYTVLKQYDDYDRGVAPIQPELPTIPETDEKYAEKFLAYQEDTIEYGKSIEKIEAGESEIKKAFVVCGNDKGKYVFIKPKSSKATIAISGEGSEDGIKIQKSKLLEKKKRGYELDDEKLHKNVIQHLRDLPVRKEYKADRISLSDVEQAALIVMAYSKAGYQYEKQLNALLGLPERYSSYNDGNPAVQAILKAPDNVRTFIVRLALFNEFCDKPPRSIGAAVIYELAKDWDLEAYNKMFSEQDAIKEKRDKRFAERLAELENKK